MYYVDSCINLRYNDTNLRAQVCAVTLYFVKASDRFFTNFLHKRTLRIVYNLTTSVEKNGRTFQREQAFLLSYTKAQTSVLEEHGNGKFFQKWWILEILAESVNRE